MGWKLNKSLLIIIPSLVAFGILWVNYLIGEKRKLMSGPVKIEISGENMNIPTSYFYSETIEKGIKWVSPKEERIMVRSISISMLLPDLEGYSRENSGEWNNNGRGKRLDLLIEEFKYGKPGIENLEKRMWNTVESSGFHEKPKEIYGLAWFKSKSNLGDVYFSNNLKTKITCDSKLMLKKTGIVSPSCFVWSSYDDKLVLQYYFSAEYLKSWRDIDWKIKSLVKEFIENAG